MRKNLPVTGREIPLAPDDLIVSQTDDKGRISWVNPTFLRISGFDEAELIGSPHNIVRHPDMPAEAFADMWRTLKSGRPWTGLVKNRCKNGDHYWVRANVTPVRQGSRIVGFLSVRGCPNRAEVEAAGRIYGQIASNERSGWVIINGEALRRGPGLWLRAVKNLPIRHRTALFALGSLATMAIAGAAMVAGGPVSANVGWAALAAGAAWIVAGWAWIDRTWLGAFEATQQAAEQVASGRLTVAFPHSADPGMQSLLQAISQMTMNMRAVIGDIRSRINDLTDSPTQLTERSGDLASRTDSQASAQQQTAASVEQLTSAIQQSAGSAERAAALAGTASQQASAGGEIVNRAVDAMGLIAAASDRIGNFVGVINDVAFQTNILALNAAVEAARAGDAGRGFAVVASEVRVLAQRCASAAREIREQVSDTLERVGDGKIAADEAGQAMQRIVESVKQVTMFVSDIARASEEQSQGLDQINQAMSSMEAVGEQNTSLVGSLAELSRTWRKTPRRLAARSRPTSPERHARGRPKGSCRRACANSANARIGPSRTPA
jgi:aerotaxis receptor